jgi:SHS2 domain-containing protein
VTGAAGGHDRLDTPGEVGIQAWGPTVADAFRQTVLGVFALLAEPDAVEERDVREVRAHGSTLEALLASWINECLYVHEVEGFVARDLAFAAFQAEPLAGGEPLRLHAALRGEEVDPVRHGQGTPVRAALAHRTEVSRTETGWLTRVILEA